MLRQIITIALGLATTAGCSEGRTSPLQPGVALISADSGDQDCLDFGDWSNGLSPTGDFMAVSDAKGHVLLERSGSAAWRLNGLTPSGWSQRDVLWLRDEAGRIWRWHAGRLSEPEAVNREIERRAKATSFGLPAWSYVQGQDGLLFYARPSMALFRVIDAERGSSFRWEVGSAWNEPRPAVQFLTLGSASGERFVAFVHERMNPTSQAVTMRIEVVNAEGELVYHAETAAQEFRLLPWIVGQSVRAIARDGEFRCPGMLDTSGRFSSSAGCDEDVQYVVLTDDGEVAATTSFTSFSTSDFEGVRQGVAARGLGRVTPTGERYYEQLDNEGQLSIVASQAGAPAEPYAAAFQKRRCEPTRAVLGEDLTTLAADGLRVFGKLYRPTGQELRGTVLFFHGGPYQAATDAEGGLIRALVDRGYAVAAANYRGTPGYGMNYMQQGYAGGPAAMSADGEALLVEAKRRLDTTVPSYVYGVSWGGYLALQSMARSKFEGGLIQSGVCTVALSATDVDYRDDLPPRPLESAANPSAALHQMKMGRDAAGLCEGALPLRTPVVVLHSRDDAVAPFAPMEGWSRLNQATMIAVPGRRHPAPELDGVAGAADAVVQVWGTGVR